MFVDAASGGPGQGAWDRRWLGRSQDQLHSRARAGTPGKKSVVVVATFLAEASSCFDMCLKDAEHCHSLWKITIVLPKSRGFLMQRASA